MPEPASKTVTFPFANRGVVAKAQAGALQDGQYQFMQDMTSIEENSICTRPGRKKLGVMDAAHTGGGPARTLPHTGAKLTIGDTDTSNLRYVGESQDIFRTSDYVNYTQVATGVVSAADAEKKRWTMAQYNAGTNGEPWGYFASPNMMLRDRGTSPFATLQNWGILPAWGVATAAAGAAGNPDGGDPASPLGSSGYKYVFCYVNKTTGEKGNPSQIPLARLAVNLKAITVTVWGTADAQIASGVGSKSIAIYREGGTFTDGLYRLVGYADNSGVGAASPTSSTFSDNAGDLDLIDANLCEWDNDPPVPSTLKTPIVATLTNAEAAGWQDIQITGTDPNTVGVTVGSKIDILGPNAESIIIYSYPAAGTVHAYLQNAHSAGEQFQITYITAQPCRGVLSAFDSLFVYGDPNNPQNLYKSKTGRPCSFPTINSSGVAQVIPVGSPSNGIVAATEYDGQIICLNKSNIFAVRVWEGQMFPAVATPAQRGLFAKFAWCVGNGALYYLGYDGIYAWQGGLSVKISEALDPLFIAEYTKNFAPFDLTEAHRYWIRFEFFRNQLFVMYQDLAGYTKVIAYHTLWERWEPAVWNGAEGSQVTNFFIEPDTGRFIVCRYSVTGGVISEFGVDDYHAGDGTTWATDEWTTDGADGIPLWFKFKTGFYHMGSPHVNKVFEEIFLELDNPVAITVNIYYDYSGVMSSDGWTIPAGARRRVSLLHYLQNFGTIPSPVYGSEGTEAYSIAFEFTYSGDCTKRITFYALTFQYRELGEVTAGKATPWADLGYQYDKRLANLWVKFDTGGSDTNLYLDTKSGIDGNTYNQAVQTFLLHNTAGKRETEASFAIPAGTICKMARLRPASKVSGLTNSSETFVKIIDWRIEIAEKLPPDIVLFTNWDDSSSPYLKYYEQIILDVDTGGQAVPFTIQSENGVNLITGLTATTTADDRLRRITLPSNKSAYRVRVIVDPAQIPPGGKWQVVSVNYIAVPADKGPVAHTFDWDDLGHEWDKLLEAVTIEWDLTGATEVTMQMDTLSGLNGTTQTADVVEFALTTARGKKTFGIPGGLIVKMIRLYPKTASPAITFKHWKYSVKKTDYPPDIIYITPNNDFGYPFEKYGRELILDINTNGIACGYDLRADGVSQYTGSVTTTINDRTRAVPLPVNKIGKLWQLVFTPGAGGMAQLFAWNLDALKDPPDQVLFTEWRDFDWPWDKNCRVLTMNINTGGVACSFILEADNGTIYTSTVTTTINDRERSFALPNDLIGKLWRLRFTPGAGGKSQLWDWNLDAIRDPADIVLFTEWTDFGCPFGSIARNLVLTIDTGGVNCAVYAQNENGTVQTFTVNSTYTTRRQILPFASSPEPAGKMWRLVLAPGVGGKAKLWPGWSVDPIREPAQVYHLDTYENIFGWIGWKFIKQVWLKFKCAGTVTMTLYTDTGALAFSWDAHTTRQLSRKLMPVNQGAVLMKSKVYRVVLDSATGTPFRIYPESSKFEVIPFGADRRQAYLQIPMAAVMAPSSQQVA